MPSRDSATVALEARRVRGVQTGIVLAVIVVVLRLTPWTQNLLFPLIENSAYDVAHDYSAPTPPGDIIIVEIDDKSLAKLGRFQSWHRDIYAELLDKPLEKAKVVAFDILFPEPDEERWREASGSGEGTADDIFAAAIKRHGRVVLAAHWGPANALDTPDMGLVRRFAYPRSRGRLAHGKQGETIILPTRKLAQVAAAIGYVDIDADRDGVYRRFRPMMIGPDSLIIPHIGVAVGATANDLRGDEVVSGVPAGAYAVDGGGADAMRIEADGASLIRYCGPTGTIPRVSLSDVLEGDTPADTFDGKIAIVGATAPGLYDIRPAPYRQNNRLFFGVETNANITDTLLRGRVLKDSRGSYGWAAFAFALGVLTTLVVWLTRETFAALVGVFILAGIGAPSFFLGFTLLDAWTPYGAVLLACALPLVVGLYDRLTTERRLIRRQFDVYVSPDVLKELMGEPDVIRASKRREVTLLFADVRGSTTLSENIPPEVWIAQLNEYLTQMSMAIFDYDGYLDKFMGDGIMAVWNAFGTQEEEHAALAVKAGLQMQRRLELLNKAWERMDNRTPLRIGIGVHTGAAVMGNVGSEDRMQYTAIGDTVNTASRVEGMCKTLGVDFIVSESTARLLGDEVTVRAMGTTEVRGRSAGIDVYEVVSGAEDTNVA